MSPGAVLRESRIVGGACTFIALWALSFTTAMIFELTKTSHYPWQLMWIILFGSAGWILVIGVALHRFRVRAVALFGLFVAAGVRSALGLLDQNADQFFMWLFIAGTCITEATINWWPITCD